MKEVGLLYHVKQHVIFVELRLLVNIALFCQVPDDLNVKLSRIACLKSGLCRIISLVVGLSRKAPVSDLEHF